MPRDVLQVAAARELNSRDWRFHKPMQQWITRVQGADPKPVPGVPKGTAERGSYSVWNVEKWSIDRLDNFTLNIQDIEESAAAAQQQQQQQQQNANQQQPPQQQQQQNVPPGGQVRQ